MGMHELRFAPHFTYEPDPSDLDRLLTGGVLRDDDLERRIQRLAARFRAFVENCPAPEWAPGLIVTEEMRRVTDQYLCIDEIKRAFERLFYLAFRVPPFFAASTVHRAPFWLDALDALQSQTRTSDPSAILKGLMSDETRRCRFIFANFLPPRHGEAFGRYPKQLFFLREWLARRRCRPQSPLRLLDSACGTGEGTWELPLLLRESGYRPDEASVTGATIEPVELFAAAHVFFPHDAGRQGDYRQKIAPLLETGWMERVEFRLDDIRRNTDDGEYDVILCNGILGGPLLHDEEELAAAVSSLAGRLRPGGILLAANRFHGGWKKLVQQSLLEKLFARHGLSPLTIGEGIAAEYS